MHKDRNSWPQFLDLIDSDPEQAFSSFYKFAYETLTSVPPRPMLDLDRADQDDLISEIIYYCVKDGFRVLKQYTDQGKAFAGWLYVLAHKRSIDYLRVSKRYNRPSDSPQKIENEPRLVEVARAVKEAIEKLDEYCRVLLQMAADEFTPKEMTVVLRLTSDQNKKVSDDLRYCRQKLKKRLSDNGLTLESLF